MLLYRYTTNVKNRSMGPVLTWPNITIVVNILFEEILALTGVRSTVTSKGVFVHPKF